MEYPVLITLAGVTYDNAQEHIKKFGYENYEYELVREDKNIYDKNAISVKCQGFHLGYIPKQLAVFFAREIDSGKEFEVKFHNMNTNPNYETVGLNVLLQLKGE